MQAAELKVASITEDNAPTNSLATANIPPLISTSVTNGEDALEQAAKSLQKLYVNPVSWI